MQNYLYVRDVLKDATQVSLDFDYKFTDTVSFTYSFTRPLIEPLNVFLKRLQLKLTQAKYKKNFKNKEPSIFHSCNVKVFEDSLECIDTKSIVLNDLLKRNLYIHINDCIYKCIANPKWIISCQIPKYFMVNCPAIPKVEVLNGSIDDIIIRWYVKKDEKNNDWEFVQSSLVFIPTQSQLNHFIKAEISTNLEIKSQKFSFISKDSVKSFPQTDYQMALNIDKMKLSQDFIRICSYNVLSDNYANTKDARERIYRHCDPSLLLLPYRQCLLTYELLTVNSDIILIQECDTSFFNDVLLPLFGTISFNGIHQSKTGRVSEGGALLWRKDIFSLVRNISIENLSVKLGTSTSETCTRMRTHIEKNERLYRRWQSLSHCMTGCVLRYNFGQSDKFMVIANNHLFYHPEYELLRLYQVYIVLAEVKAVLVDYPDAAVIIAGDFNSSYEDATIQFVMDQHIEYKSDLGVIKLDHSLGKLESAFYDKVEFTNFTLDYVGILDHIFFNSGQMKVHKTHPLPNKEDIQSNQALPNKYHPSDHLPLVLDFTL